MGSLDWGLELVLVALLAITLVHAIRLERALRTLRDDRAALGDAIAGFDTSAREAEAGIGRLQTMSSGTTDKLSQLVGQGGKLGDDLHFLIGRGESLADRLDELIRTSRPMMQGTSPARPVTDAPVAPAPTAPPPASPAPKVRSKAERDLLLALQGAGQ